MRAWLVRREQYSFERENVRKIRENHFRDICVRPQRWSFFFFFKLWRLKHHQGSILLKFMIINSFLTLKFLKINSLLSIFNFNTNKVVKNERKKKISYLLNKIWRRFYIHNPLLIEEGSNEEKMKGLTFGR